MVFLHAFGTPGTMPASGYTLLNKIDLVTCSALPCLVSLVEAVVLAQVITVLRNGRGE